MCWLHFYYAEAVYVQSMQERTLRQSEFHQKRITLAHNRHLSAIRTLAQVRHLGMPAIATDTSRRSTMCLVLSTWGSIL
jgi:hypothetical protein